MKYNEDLTFKENEYLCMQLKVQLSYMISCNIIEFAKPDYSGTPPFLDTRIDEMHKNIIEFEFPS